MAKTYNITEVGTLTNNDGVISGFSSSNYAQTTTTFNWGNSWELGLKFTYVATGGRQTLISPDETDAYGSILIVVNEWGNLGIYLGSDNASWNISDGPNYMNVYDGTTYYIKITFDGTNYTLHYSTDGESYVTQEITTNSTPIYSGLGLGLGIERYGSGNPWAGSIDLNGCYTKISNTLVWEGVTVPTYTGTHIQLRHDTASNWSDVNPTLLEGEVGIETDTNKMKIGDGVTAYNSLTYFGGGGGGTVDQTYNASSTNAQSGVAIAGAGFLTSSTGVSSTTIRYIVRISETDYANLQNPDNTTLYIVY